MKLRYQMRGLGIGMIVTALMMGLTAEKVPLSDAEIRARAAELGMVEIDSLKLTDLQNTPLPAESPSPEQGGKAEAEPTSDSEEISGDEAISDLLGEETDSEAVSDSGEGADSEAVSDSGEGAGGEAAFDSGEGAGGEAAPDREGAGSEEIPDPEAEDEAGSAAEKITIVVEPGITSYRVCIMLAEAGLVEDAAAFDTYLCDNGYSRKIDFGTYEIPVGVSEEEIAKIITRNR